MFIKCLKVGPLETNCYILCDKVTNKAAVIDPGYDAQRIAMAIEDTQCDAEYIILTHAHRDHFGAVHELKQIIKHAKLTMLSDELALLNDSVRNLYSYVKNETSEIFSPDFLMHDGEILKLGMLELKFIQTPGHTQGSCCILCQDVLFTGDTLFKEDVGPDRSAHRKY